MYLKLGPINIWPSRELEEETMPQVLEENISICTGCLEKILLAMQRLLNKGDQGL